MSARLSLADPVSAAVEQSSGETTIIGSQDSTRGDDVVPRESERLRETLSELHNHLESAESIDAELREPLQTLMDDIHALLDRSQAGGEDSEQRSLIERLSKIALRFEVSHPTIAGALNQLTHKLSDMGI
jgi:hypothetical protein